MSDRDGRRPVVLVTGAARGIGRATVDAFVAAGWHAVAGVRDVATAAYDDPYVTVTRMDVTDHASVAAGVRAAEELAGGALDAVVCNAGYALLGAVEDVAMDEVRAVFETNTFGALATIQAAVPAMRARRRGTVVVVSTIGADLPTPLVGAYRASKAALNALTEVLATELRPFGVRVGRVEPGMVATDFSQATRRSGSVTEPDGPYADLASGLFAGMRRWRGAYECSAAEVAGAILAFAREADAPSAALVGDDARRLHGTDADGILRFLEVEWPRLP